MSATGFEKAVEREPPGGDCVKITCGDNYLTDRKR